MKVRKLCLVVTCLTAVIALAGSRIRAAELIVNGGFENEPNYAGHTFDLGSFALLTGNELPGWTIANGHSVTIHNHPSHYNYPTISGTYSVNTDGEGDNRHNADFYQDFASSAGASYLLQYDWENWFGPAGAKLEVLVTDTVTSSVLYDAVLTTTGGIKHETGLFSGTGNALELRVRENPESGFNDNQFIVDNFSVTTTSAVPEPSSIALLGIGAIGLAVAAYRRK